MSQSQAEFFDSIADQWDSWEKPDISERIARVIELAEIKPCMSIMDVGAGTGVLLPGLSDALGPQGRILAIDVSSGMLGVAAKKGIPTNVRLLQSSLEDLPLELGGFDRVMCNAVFPHFPDWPLALGRIRGLLNDDGWLVISHPIGREAVNRVHSESNSTVSEDSVPDNDLMRSLLSEAGFKEIRIIDEPEFHMALGVKRN